MPTKCDGCGLEFKSRNAVFRHLKDTNGACLPPESYGDFHRYVLSKERKKVVLLYGYTIVPKKSSDNSSTTILSNGQEAAFHLLQTLEEQISSATSSSSSSVGEDDTHPTATESSKINRSYGTNGRNEETLQQDDGTGAVTEVLATRLPRMLGSVEDWLASINGLLEQKGLSIRVFGRMDMPHSKFNAEMDVSHRRVEYLLPADFLVPGQDATMKDFFNSLPSFLDGSFLGTHRSQVKRRSDDDDNTTTPDSKIPRLDALNVEKSRPGQDTLTYLYALKKKMQSLTTHIVELDEKDEAAVLEKRFHKQKRKKQRYKTDHKDNTKKDTKGGKKFKEDVDTDKIQNKQVRDSKTQKDSESTSPSKVPENDKKKEDSSKENGKNTKKGTHVLQRKRFHNFTPKVLAHDFFAYRRMDRMYHRATLRFPDAVYEEVEKSMDGPVQLDRYRPFMALSMTGDMFLHGQACRVIGLFIALARGVIDQDFVDCVFDEDYPHLVPTPPAPTFAMYAGEAFYTSWEGKCQKILTPRHCNRYPGGWNSTDTRQRVNEYQAVMREEIAKVWLAQGVDADGRLLAEKKWTEEVLEPWAVQAHEQLENYRQWKENPTTTITYENGVTEEVPESLPPLDSIDTTVPALYEKVLQCLRDADKSGLWPSTTPKRQMVMVSTPKVEGVDSNNTKNSVFSSLSAAHMKAKKNNEERSSAYEFKEGEGGASGSFSVGAMPGEKGCHQPKGNTLFPELTKAAFELERALHPYREPSSTIAINRNAQFRPHTDSGAGAGQSRSLIVALGDFVGGELMVEGQKKDIRYNAIEFNGWTQRHWTMPFRGERYSLVWFTPKGCEGVHGIDLCTT